MADFNFEDHGTVWLVTPTTEEATEHLQEMCSGAMWFGHALVCEHRFAEDLAAALEDDGFTTEV